MAIANTPESWVTIDDDVLVAEVDESIRQAQQGCAHALEHLVRQKSSFLLDLLQGICEPQNFCLIFKEQVAGGPQSIRDLVNFPF